MKHLQIHQQHAPNQLFVKAEQLYNENEAQLNLYLDQLLWWNERVNLVSRNVPRGTLRNHVEHSLLLTNFAVFNAAEKIVDAGTGGGLPGIPLAIAHPEKLFVLNDIVSKKCLAMKQMARKLGLDNVQIVDGSIEKLDQATPFLLISKHAFKVDELYKMTAAMPWQELIFYKGLHFEDELIEIDDALRVEVFDLTTDNDFYKEKAIVIVSRMGEGSDI